MSELAVALAACSNAELSTGTSADRAVPDRGDSTEVGLLRLARWLGADPSGGSPAWT